MASAFILPSKLLLMLKASCSSKLRKQWPQLWTGNAAGLRSLAATFLKTLALQKKIYVIRTDAGLPREMAKRVLEALRVINHEAALVVMKRAGEGEAPGEAILA